MRKKETISSKRSSLLKKNIIASFLIKGWSAGVQLLLVPLTIACLGSYVNGVWMVIASMLLWIDNFDIGLGNGLRNRLAESIALSDEKSSRQYLSTAFVMLSIMMVIVAAIAAIVLMYIDTYSLLNINRSLIKDFTEVLIVSMVITSATFVFKLTGNVYLALQLPAVNNLIIAISQTLTLCSVFVLYQLGCQNLIAMALAYTLAPLLSYICAFIYTFTKRIPNLRPRLSDFSKQKVGSLLNLGIKFFILQIAGIILFMSSSIIVSNLYTPESVTPYQVAYRLFSLSMVVFMLVITPYWSATTDAYKRKDYEWIKSSQKKLHKILIVIGLILAVMVAMSKWIYHLWIGDLTEVSFSLSLFMAIYLFEIIYSQAYSFLLNGMGILNLQLIMTTIAALLFIPLAVLIGKHTDVEGICIALIIVNLPGTIVNVLQFNHVIASCQKQTA